MQYTFPVVASIVNSFGKNAKYRQTVPLFRTREIVLPRFKLEQNYDLIENLKEMGLTDLFTESGDFTGMTSEKVAMNWVSRINSAMISPKILIQSPVELINFILTISK